MKYVSTRDESTNLYFEDVLFSGFLTDGGIAMPADIKPLSDDQLQGWIAGIEYSQVVAKILRHFIDANEISDQEIESIVSKSYLEFTDSRVIVLKQLTENLFMGELFHGPTFAFKDLALSVLGRLLHHFLEKRRKRITILVGTSGDTGGAAIHAVKDSPWIDIVVLFPKGRCTSLQEYQMTGVTNNNVHCFEVEGTSDDLDAPIKACFEDSHFVKTHNLCSVNSINWARILVQAAHFFYLYGRICCAATLEVVSFVIPTGAAGHLTAALIAKMLGLPMEIVSCVNSNNVIHRTVSTGHATYSGHAVTTLASAMDILVPYNLERILYLLSENNSRKVKTWLEQLESKKELHLPQEITDLLQTTITTHSVSDTSIRKSISRCWELFHYKICPHTATGMDYIFELEKSKLKHICLATASPVKFPEALKESGVRPEPFHIPQIQTNSEKMIAGADWYQILHKKIESISSRNLSVLL